MHRYLRNMYLERRISSTLQAVYPEAHLYHKANVTRKYRAIPGLYRDNYRSLTGQPRSRILHQLTYTNFIAVPLGGIAPDNRDRIHMKVFGDTKYSSIFWSYRASLLNGLDFNINKQFAL